MVDNWKKMDSVYQARKNLDEKYSAQNPGNAFNLQILLQHLSDIFKSHIPDISKATLLDMGTGELFWPDCMTSLGLSRENCIGVDILHWRMVAGHNNKRNISAITADSSQLPFRDACFDIITQFTLMTSVLDDSLRRKIIDEMLRVLKPGGYIIWYDFRYNNPGNPHTRAVGKRELLSLFPEQKVNISSLTLLPPLARKIPAGLTPLLKLLHVFPMLRSHYLALIGPKG